MGVTSSQEPAITEQRQLAFIHEAGHALMAALTGVTCQGIAFHASAEQFCTILPGDYPPVSQDGCLITAAGAAAERIFFPELESEGSGTDRAEFSSGSTLTFDQAVEASRMMMLTNGETLEKIVAALMARARGINYVWTRLPVVRVGTALQPCRLLLGQDRLRDIIQPAALVRN